MPVVTDEYGEKSRRVNQGVGEKMLELLVFGQVTSPIYTKL